jgi:DNA-binding NarL/FixJ family response regulator
MKILLADDHAVVRDGIRTVLRKLGEQVTVYEAHDYPSAFQVADRTADLDLALIDLYMPGTPGYDGVRLFRERHPGLALVVMSAADEPDEIQRILACGALGYITKSSSTELILSALKLVLAGGVYIPSPALPDPGAARLRPVDRNQKLASLTQRQLTVLKELVSGKSNHQIAQKLQVTEGTIKVHMSAIFRVLNVSNRSEALLAAQRMGIR